MPNKLIVANWKMNGVPSKILTDLGFYLDNEEEINNEIVFAMPTIYLDIASSLVAEADRFSLSAQDVSRFDAFGAYTGEVNANMLKQYNVAYSLVGHSERREYFAENDETLLAKLNNLLHSKITPIFCVGESLEMRKSGNYLEFILKQLSILSKLDLTQSKKFVVAYEPIWSIGTGLVPTISEIEEVVNNIDSYLKQNLSCGKIYTLYGGSVSATNVKSILALSKVSGVLVGGASLKSAEFLEICKA